VPLQCAIAAGMLQALLAIRHGNIQEAAAMYNSGSPDDAHTTGHDYGTDVVQRMGFLQQKFGNIISLGGPPPAWFHRDLGLASPFMQGDDVKVVQKKTGAAADGQYGPITESRVVNFQSHHSLVTDGIVGAQTARALGA
jgi:peptidoglycan hydrolase-like protein with peptidoglycan-binding domain